MPSGVQRSRTDHLPHSLTCNSLGSSRNKQEWRISLSRERRSAIAKIDRERFLCRPSKWDDALFIALAAHQHISHVEFYVFELQRHHFRNSQRTGVKNFEHRAIAQQKHRLRTA